MEKQSTAFVQIAVCLSVVVMGSMLITSFGVFAPHFVQTFDSPVAIISWAASIILLAIGLAAPLLGRLLDVYSVRRILMSGGLLLIAGLASVSFAKNVAQLLVCYLIMGLGVATFSPMVAVKHMTVWFPHRLGLATSLVCMPLGAVLFPPLSQWFIGQVGWRQSFQVFAVVAVVVWLLLLFLRPSPDSLDNAHSDEMSGNEGVSFAKTDRLGSFQVYRALLQSGFFWFAVLACSIFLAAPISMMTHLIVLAQNKGFEASEGVLLLTIMGVASLIGAPLSGVISDRFGPSNGFRLLAVCQGAALAFLLLDGSYPALLISAVTVGLFMSAAYVFFAGFVTQVIGTANFGTGFGLATLLTAVIGAFPPVIAGTILDSFGSYNLFFGVLSALTFSTGIGAWLLGAPKEVAYVFSSKIQGV